MIAMTSRFGTDTDKEASKPAAVATAANSAQPSSIPSPIPPSVPKTAMITDSQRTMARNCPWSGRPRARVPVRGSVRRPTERQRVGDPHQRDDDRQHEQGVDDPQELVDLARRVIRELVSGLNRSARYSSATCCAAARPSASVTPGFKAMNTV